VAYATCAASRAGDAHGRRPGALMVRRGSSANRVARTFFRAPEAAEADCRLGVGKKSRIPALLVAEPPEGTKHLKCVETVTLIKYLQIVVN
jgi:hypothetical protein